MRPTREIPEEFFDPVADLGAEFPLVDAYLVRLGAGRPLSGVTVLLVQHQLSNQVPLVAALIRLGVEPSAIHWLDIPYTSTAAVREHVASALGVPRTNFDVCSDYRVLDPYDPYQHRRALQMIHALGELAPRTLLVLDDGAYVLEALAALKPERWPQSIAIVEQTTRGLIKMAKSAALRAAARTLPIVDVAGSVPKRTLEPPFIAMSVCASLDRRLRACLRGRSPSCLVLGYGAIGEQISTYLTTQLDVPRERVVVHDAKPERRALAVSRGFPRWDRRDLSARFDLVVGCSGQASFTVGDRVYLNDGAFLVSASSGAVELSRRDFVELADASDRDDIAIDSTAFDPLDIHAQVPIRLVDRTVTFVNAGFPVNFDGRVTNVPDRFIQPTPTMMIAAAVQAIDSLRSARRGLLELHPTFCDWIDATFRKVLGDEAHYLVPPPAEAW